MHKTEMCKKHNGLQHMQHLDVYPVRYQPCPDPPFYKRCVCIKKKSSGEIKGVKMYPATSSYSPIAQPGKVFYLHIFMCFGEKYIYLTSGLTFMQSTPSKLSEGFKKFR